MIIVTANSQYLVEIIDGGKFRATKVSAMNPQSKFLQIGDTHEFNYFSVCVGCSAYMDDVHTSEVKEIRP